MRERAAFLHVDPDFRAVAAAGRPIYKGSVQEKLEANCVGRLLISAFVIVTVGSMVVWNMPSSELKQQGLRLARPYIAATGLDQSWTVFAPNPTRETFELYARVTYADGTNGTWHVPTGGTVFGAYWDYRWIKWSEWTIGNVPTSGRIRKALCEGTADYIANHELNTGRDPRRIDLVRRWYVTLPPGHRPAHGPWRESIVCAARIR